MSVFTVWRRPVLGKILTATFLISASTAASARNIYLNGIDISSARHQMLQGVTVRIDGDGNLYIEAPHYQVNEQASYLPFSSWNHPAGSPQHQAPGRQPERAANVGPTSEAPLAGTLQPSPVPAKLQQAPASEGQGPRLQEKEGTKLSQ